MIIIRLSNVTMRLLITNASTLNERLHCADMTCTGNQRHQLLVRPPIQSHTTKCQPIPINRSRYFSSIWFTGDMPAVSHPYFFSELNILKSVITALVRVSRIIDSDYSSAASRVFAHLSIQLRNKQCEGTNKDPLAIC